ncbi:MAG: acyl carrier protein [Dactylosporangium sp.]|nr:hypothetical protein [Dactylosporangium sp.]NNJ62050.1 acyl carrier protein [Dactylosporangium sp.]
MTTLSQQVAALVHAASEGEIAVSDALAGGASLLGLGLGSLGFLRLVDALERDFDVDLDLDEGFGGLDQVAWIVERLGQLGVGSTTGDKSATGDMS